MRLKTANEQIVHSIETISAISEEVSAHANETMSAQEDNSDVLNKITDRMQQLSNLQSRRHNNVKAYDNYIFDLYGTLVDIHTEENDPLVWKKLALFYGYYDADYSSEELKERYAAIIAGEEYKMKSEKKDDAHEAHPEVQIEEVFQKLFEEKGVKADLHLPFMQGSSSGSSLPLSKTL